MKHTTYVTLFLGLLLAVSLPIGLVRAAGQDKPSEEPAEPALFSDDPAQEPPQSLPPAVDAAEEQPQPLMLPTDSPSLPNCETPEQFRNLVEANPGGTVTLTGDIVWDNDRTVLGTYGIVTTIEMNGYQLAIPADGYFRCTYFEFRGENNDRPLVEVRENGSFHAPNSSLLVSGVNSLGLLAISSLTVDIDLVQANGPGAQGAVFQDVGPDRGFIRVRRIEVAGTDAVGMRIRGTWNPGSSPSTSVVSATGTDAVALYAEDDLYLESFILQASGTGSLALSSEANAYLRFCWLEATDGLAQAAGELVLDACDSNLTPEPGQTVARSFVLDQPLASDYYCPLGVVEGDGLEYNYEFLILINPERTDYSGSYFSDRLAEQLTDWHGVNWDFDLIDYHTIGAYPMSATPSRYGYPDCVLMPTLETTVHVGYYPHQILSADYPWDVTDLAITMNIGRQDMLYLAFDGLVIWYRTDTEQEWRSHTVDENDFYPLYANIIRLAGFADYAFSYGYWLEEYWQDGKMVPPHQYLELQVEYVGGPYAGRNSSYYLYAHPDPDADFTGLPHVPDQGDGDQGGGDDGSLPGGNSGGSGSDSQQTTPPVTTADQPLITTEQPAPDAEEAWPTIAQPPSQLPQTEATTADQPATAAEPVPAGSLRVSAAEINAQLAYDQTPLTLIQNELKVVLPTAFLEALNLTAEAELSLVAEVTDGGFSVQLWLDGVALSVLPGQAFQLYYPLSELAGTARDYACQAADGSLIYADGYENGWLIFTLPASGSYLLIAPASASPNDTPTAAAEIQPKQEPADDDRYSWWAFVGGGVLLGAVIGGLVGLRIRRKRRKAAS